MLQIPELLAPAGDLERLRYAINYGADAVYCALPEFGMRSAPTNFTPEQLTEGVIYAHARGRKVYLTMNTLPTNEEADRLPQAIKDAAAAGVDAFIVADLGVLDTCKTFAPDIDVHMSTQTGITNWAAARAAYNMGAKRVVLTGVSFTPDKLGAMGYDSCTDTYFTCLDRRQRGSFHGTGDIFAATVVGGMMRGLSLEEAASLAVRFTLACIDVTARDPQAGWYGVEFEKALPLLCDTARTFPEN